MPHQKGKQKKIETKDENVSDLLRATAEALRLKTGLSDKGWKVAHEDKDEHKHVDLAIHKAKIVIEVDGTHHNRNSKQAISDIKRTFHDFVQKDVITLRVPNSVLNDNETIEEAVTVLDNLLRERVNKLENEAEREKYAFIGRITSYVIYILFAYQLLSHFDFL
ncbi:hypothetical protein [uncultured Kriegella sp.]|uniref:hypothetical protein n=1 Tax=uncultured Kriegella sp. TaxID=1798910 RepID=UPI0030D89626